MCMADKFPESLPGFQKMFPDDVACAKYRAVCGDEDGNPLSYPRLLPETGIVIFVKITP